MKHIRSSRRAMALAVVAVLAVAGAAFAYWTTTGGGTGSASTGDVSAITIDQSSTPAGLYPGGDAQSLAGTITNGNDAKVKVAEVTAEVTGTDKAGCGAGNYEIDGSAPVDAEVAKGSPASFSGLTLRMLDTSSNQDACKGATVTIAYTAVPAAS